MAVRPRRLDLTADQPWRPVPMPGANRGIELVPLASHPDDLAILGRFPAGFVRDVPGGYHAAETFLVLDGSLVLDGRRLGRGDLAYVPAEVLRSEVRTEDGCLVLAWFSGPADFVGPGELGTAAGGLRTVPVLSAAPGTVLDTPEAAWAVGESLGGSPAAEHVDLSLTRWRAAGDTPVEGRVLTRVRR